MTTLSAHAAESVGHRQQRPVVRWVGGAVGVLAVVGVGVGLVVRSRPSPRSAPAAETARPPETVTLGVSDAPDGLRVWVDGAPATLPVRLPAGAETHELSFRAPGFQARTLRVDGSQSRMLTLSLDPIAPAAPAPPSAPAKPGPASAASRPPAAAPGDRGEGHKHHPHGSHPAGLTDDARKL